MARLKNLVLVLLLIFSFSLSAADKEIVIDSLVVYNGKLLLSYHIDGLMSNNTIQGLERGLTSEVFHQVRLWKNKPLISSIASEYVFSVKILYDNWEDKYRIVTQTENRLTTQIETVLDICSVVQNYPIIDANEIDLNTRYYISIQSIFKPVSAETYQELSDWLAGNPHTEQDEKSKISGGSKVFNALMNVLGFGDKELSYKSRDFTILENLSIVFLN